ncbi:hypothetical protein EDC96DRAFT_574724 [Choanephora cucurbitarum]|nr:hypothetical protein EDC96DRAFT_574724 [Choanephora cucurbitarum]
MADITEEAAWESVKDSLYFSAYWVNQIVDDWNVIDYFIKLMEKEPTMDKRMATAKIMNDLELIQAALIHMPKIKNKTTTMINLIRKKSQTVSTFWEKHSSELEMVSLDHKLYVRKTQALLEEEAVNRSTIKRKQNNSSPVPKSSKKRGVDIQIHQIEHDSITVPGSDISLATIIKRKAVKVHEKFVLSPDDLTPRQRKIMSAGLSSILDLTDQSFGSQRSIFTAEQWDYVNAYFEERLTIKQHALDDDISNAVKIVQNTLKLSNDYECAIEYVDKLKQKYSKSDKLKATTYKIIKHILKTMDNYGHLLHEKKVVRENEYMRLMWSYLLELLFPPKGIVRVVTGESENAYSTESKKEQYPLAKSVHGFKIDVRLVVEVGDEEEIDLAVGECAKRIDDNKAIKDNAKLLRECKDSIDRLINTLKDTNDDVMSYMIQITGSSCALSTMHLAANGLYVAKHRFTFNIPHRFDDLSSLPETLAQLLTMKKEVQSVADKIIKERTKTHTAEVSFNRQKAPIINDRLSWLRSTWYSPPGDQVSTVPIRCFGSPPAPIFVKEASTSTEQPKQQQNGQSTADKYGWVKLDSGEHYNIYTKETLSKHPLDF